jgi:hypothetical protein
VAQVVVLDNQMLAPFSTVQLAVFRTQAHLQVLWVQ